MSDRGTGLARRRGELLRLSSKQRARLARRLRSLDARLHVADDGIAVMQRYVVNPLVGVLAVAALFLLRRRPGPGHWLPAGLLLAAGCRAAGALEHQRMRLGEQAAVDDKAV